MPHSVKIQWRFGEDLVMRWKFSFKSGLEVVFFASILWLSHRSKEKSTDPVKIWQRFGKDLEVETHYDFNRPDRCLLETDPTWPEVVRGWQQVVQPPTQCEQVGSGLGINQTRIDSWTPCDGLEFFTYFMLMTMMSMSKREELGVGIKRKWWC